MPQKLVISLIEETQDYQQYLAEDGRRAAKAAGFTPEVVFSEANAILQIRQLFQYVHAPAAERPAAIVVMTVSGKGGEKLASAAVNAGIAWVLINRDVDYLPALRRDAPKVPSFAVSIDHTEIGRIHGRIVRSLLPGGGPVLYVKGPPEAASSVARHAGIEESLRGSGIELRVVYGDWSSASATRAVEGWLRLKPGEVRAVVAQNDAMAVAARAALREAGAGPASIPLIGCDGLPHVGQRLVREGQMTATGVLPPPTTPAIELVARSLRTGDVPPLVTKLPLASFPAESQLAARAR